MAQSDDHGDRSNETIQDNEPSQDIPAWLNLDDAPGQEPRDEQPALNYEQLRQEVAELRTTLQGLRNSQITLDRVDARARTVVMANVPQRLGERLDSLERRPTVSQETLREDIASAISNQLPSRATDRRASILSQFGLVMSLILLGIFIVIGLFSAFMTEYWSFWWTGPVILSIVMWGIFVLLPLPVDNENSSSTRS